MIRQPDLAVVTGAFSFTGNHVARRLLKQGVRIRTLTRRPDQPTPSAALWKLPLRTGGSSSLKSSRGGVVPRDGRTGLGTERQTAAAAS